MSEVDSWTQAIYAAPPVICGRRLRPFSLAHAVLLRAMGNAYAYVNKAATRTDIMIAVDVCSRTWEQNTAALFVRDVPLFAIIYRAVRWRGMRVEVADASMRTYLADFTRRAPRLDGVASGDPLKAPVEFHLHRFLCESMHFTESQAWDCSFARAWAYFDTHREWNGAKELGTEYDTRKQVIQRRMDAAHASGNKEQEDAAWAEMKAVLQEEKAALRG